MEVYMKKIAVALVLSTIMFPAFAQKSCDELKSEIAAQLDGKGVKNYKLDIVPTSEVMEQKVVGSCEGGQKKIVYKRG
jgi:hypothetical protein